MTFTTVSETDKQNDLEILNNALYFDHQGIWAYDFAAGKLTQIFHQYICFMV